MKRCILMLAIFMTACVPTVTPTPSVTPTLTSPISPLITDTPFPSPLIAGPTKTPTATPTMIPIPPSNLPNSSFEEPYHCSSAFCVADKWTGWYRQVAPDGHTAPPCDPDTLGCYITCPLNCRNTSGSCRPDDGCFWMQPEFTWAVYGQYSYRVHSGNASQVYFGYGRMFEGGVYQKITVEPGREYEFSIWMHAWMCYNYNLCAGGTVSDEPTTMHLRVGIDPMGGIDPTSSNIVWGNEGDSFDAWNQFSVKAKAIGNKLTVFTSARPDWGNDHLKINNNVYIDDADLEPIIEPPPPVGDERIYLPAVIR